jgi:hypothetical protein
LIIGLEHLLGWERLSLFGRYGYVEMIKYLMIKILLLYRSSTGVPVRSFMVVSSAGGELRSVHRGLCTVGDYDEEYLS